MTIVLEENIVSKIHKDYSSFKISLALFLQNECTLKELEEKYFKFSDSFGEVANKYSIIGENLDFESRKLHGQPINRVKIVDIDKTECEKLKISFLSTSLYSIIIRKLDFKQKDLFSDLKSKIFKESLERSKYFDELQRKHSGRKNLRVNFFDNYVFEEQEVKESIYKFKKL